MPELPDILLYLHALGPRVVGHHVERVRLVSPFLLRSIDPPLSAVEGRTIVALRRLGKRIVFELEDGWSGVDRGRRDERFGRSVAVAMLPGIVRQLRRIG